MLGSIGLVRPAGTLAKRLQVFYPRGRQPCPFPSASSHKVTQEMVWVKQAPNQTEAPEAGDCWGEPEGKTQAAGVRKGGR